MPISQPSYQDVDLDYFCDEVLETSQDSQRVVHEDSVVEYFACREVKLPPETELPFEVESVSNAVETLENTTE